MGPTDIVKLYCPGGYAGEVINQRWLKLPCRKGRCKEAGVHTHLFDLITGRMSDIDTDDTGIAQTPLSARSERPPGATVVGSAENNGIVR